MCCQIRSNTLGYVFRLCAAVGRWGVTLRWTTSTHVKWNAHWGSKHHAALRDFFFFHGWGVTECRYGDYNIPITSFPHWYFLNCFLIGLNNYSHRIKAIAADSELTLHCHCKLLLIWQCNHFQITILLYTHIINYEFPFKQYFIIHNESYSIYLIHWTNYYL